MRKQPKVMQAQVTGTGRCRGPPARDLASTSGGAMEMDPRIATALPGQGCFGGVSSLALSRSLYVRE